MIHRTGIINYYFTNSRLLMDFTTRPIGEFMINLKHLKNIPYFSYYYRAADYYCKMF